MSALAGATPCPPGIHVIERGWLSSNTIVATGKDTVVIDTGYHTHAPLLLQSVHHLLGGADVDRVFNTHLHSDHCGGNAAFAQAYPQAVISVPATAADQVRDWSVAGALYDAVGQTCPRYGFHHTHAAGQSIEFAHRHWQVLASPGHDSDSVILFDDESRTLISADALWENGFGVLFPLLDGHDAIGDQMATLDTIESLQARCVIPGHGAVFTEVNRALDAARRRIDSFIKDPVRHGQHALRVLMKFNLLELQSVQWAHYRQRFADFPVVRRLVGDAGFESQRLALADQVAQALVGAGAADWSGGLLLNR